MAKDTALWAGAPELPAIDARRSRTAGIAWTFASFSVPLTVLSVLLHRSEAISSLAFVLCMLAAFASAILGLVFAGIALLRIWQVGGQGTARAFSATLLGVVMCAPMAIAGYYGATLPRINDVTTDPILAPEFVGLSNARRLDDAALLYDVEAFWPQQIEAFPQIVPLRFDVDFDTALEIVQEAIADEGWREVAVRAREGEPRQVTLEAVSRTLIAGFEDDIAIRLSEGVDFVRIDMRSASRFGEHDLGANARRVIGFFELLERKLRQKNRV